jgi:signal transduction histidine kinase
MPNTKPKILAVDDRPQNLYLLQRLLEKMEVEFFQAGSGKDALALTLEHDFCLAIVDVQMPEMDGYELVELLRSNESTATLPVIFVSAIYSDEYHHRRGYDAGAVDFMSKPFNAEILRHKIQVFMDLYNKRRGLEEVITQLNTANQALSRRAVQLQVSNEIGRQVNSLLNLETLLVHVVQTIQSRFGYAWVGLWLLNDAEDTLTLQATSQDHADLKTGYAVPAAAEHSIVAQVCGSGERYLNGAIPAEGADPLPETLSQTRTRLALPLKMGQRQLGVLDIQSEQAASLADEDLTVLGTIADQVAIAVRNASLYSEVVSFKNHLEDLVTRRTAELQKAYQTLEKMDKNKSDFINIAAHELRTPLTIMTGYADMLREELSEQPDNLMMIEGIVRGQARLLEVVNSMLDATRIDSELLEARKEPVSLPTVFRKVSKNYIEDLEQRRLTLTINDIDALPVIRADSELIFKLFNNLVVNAIKYTPDGGTITVNGEAHEPGADGALDVPYIEFTVADTGIGIDPAYHELIFEKFYQTGEVRFHSSGRTNFKAGGPGLGLSIAKGIVNAHRGRIWVESPGYDEKNLPGSVFHVQLPIS